MENKRSITYKHLALAALLGVMLICGILEVRHSRAKATPDVAAESYLYLAELAMASEDTDTAELYLEKMYADCGESPEGTLAYARLCVMKQDYVGAGALYTKLANTGQAGLMNDLDTQIATGAVNGTLVDVFSATAALDYMKGLEESGISISEYGYTEEQRTSFTAIANGSYDPMGDMKNFLAQDTATKKNANAQLASLENASLAAEALDKEYKDYLASGSYDPVMTDQCVAILNAVQKDAPSALKIPALDEAYIRAQIMKDEKEKLIDYAVSGDSQLAMAAVGQLVADGAIKEKDLPSDFLTLKQKDVQAVGKQCEQALKKIRKKNDNEGAAVREAEAKVEAVLKIAEKPALVEVERRIQPEKEELSKQSALYLADSALCYAAGNTDKGDAMFKKSMETAPYADNDKFEDSMRDVSSAMYNADGDIGAGEDTDAYYDNDVKDVGESVQEAYVESVPFVSPHVEIPEDEDEEGSGNPFHQEETTEAYGNPFSGIIDSDDTEEQPPIGEMPLNEKLTALEELTAAGTTYVTKESAALNIGKIDVSGFPTVSFNLQTSKPLDLKNPGLIINDCNIAITDYTVTEKKFDKAIIYAVCDKSGSMEGSTGSLQSAVYSLAGSLSKNEQMGLIGFSDGVDFDSGIVSDPSQLTEYISMLEADGGTNIASGTFAALSHISGSEDTINVVIVMTDGEDSSFDSGTLAKLAEYTSNGHTMVYTVGMGSSVNSGYLSQIARAGNGRSLHSFSSRELKAIYDFVHTQMENNYVVTFTAKNTKSNNRVLTVANSTDGFAVSKEYTLGRDEDEEEDGDVVVYGFSNKKIYKENEDVTASIRGKGFKNDMECNVTLVGDGYRGSITGSFVSETQFVVTIPAKVPPGKYRAMIAIGSTAYKDEIEILDGDEKIFRYGAYWFYGDKVIRDEENQTVTIKGNVMMNGYLNFGGDVVINGDTLKETVSMTSEGGSRVVFSAPLPGLLELFCNSVSVGSWHGYTLHKDEAHMKDLNNYTVESVSIPNPVAMVALVVTDPEYKLYPHKLEYKAASVAFNFPTVTQVLETYHKTPFKFDADFGGYLDANGHHSKGHVNVEDLGVDFHIKAFKFQIKKASFSWDTYNNDYGLAFVVKTGFGLKKDNAFGFEIAFKGGKWDAAKLYIDIPWPVVIEPVPVTIRNFIVGFSDLSSVSQDASFGATLLQMSWEGSCDIEVSNLTELIPGANSFFGSLPLVAFKDTKVKANFHNASFSLTSNVTLFGELNIGEVEAYLGKYTFTNYVLGIVDAEVAGVFLRATVGPNLDLPRLKIKGQGTLELGINDKNAYTYMAGELEFMLDFIKKLELKGRLSIENGIYGENGSLNLYYNVKRDDIDGLKKGDVIGAQCGISGWWPYVKLLKKTD